MTLTRAHKVAARQSGEAYFIVRDPDAIGGYAVSDAFDLVTHYHGDEPLACYLDGELVD